MTAYALEVPWPEVHAVCRAVSDARSAGGIVIGSQGLWDPWGGSYCGGSWEARGLAGLASILHGADLIRHAAWDMIHAGHRMMADGPARGKDTARAHAARVVAHRDQVLARVRGAVRVSLALHDLYTILGRIGIDTYDPSSTICGVDASGILHVHGLRWMAGEAREDRAVYASDALAFAEGAPISVVLRCQDLTANATAPLD